MAAVYVHLSGRDLEEPLLKLYGLQKEETKQESRLKPITCWKCKTTNPADAIVCVKCGMFLKVETAVQAEEKGKKELEDMRQQLNSLATQVSLLTSGMRLRRILYPTKAALKVGEAAVKKLPKEYILDK